MRGCVASLRIRCRVWKRARREPRAETRIDGSLWNTAWHKGVLQDLTAWWPKLKVGGLMAGDDYHNGWVEIARYTFGVKDAVDEFFGGGARDHRVYVTTHHDFDARPEPQMPQWYVLKCAE